jgi:protein-L-isoaspartate(D-aspartate) O-methyltransferase
VVLAEQLREIARACRIDMVSSAEQHLGPFDPLHLRAVLEVPRERFVRPEELALSAEDIPLPLDDAGLATISAPHAYLLSYRLLGLAPGDTMLELGSGTGYGAALASYIVGPEGWVHTVEIDPTLARRAASALAGSSNVTVVQKDAMDAMSPRISGGVRKIVATFAIDELPPAWLGVLPEGGRLVAPVGSRAREQRLVLVTRENGLLRMSDHGAVRYVKNRSSTR